MMMGDCLSMNLTMMKSRDRFWLLKTFLEYQGHAEEAASVGTIIDTVSELSTRNNMHNFFCLSRLQCGEAKSTSHLLQKISVTVQ